MEIIEIDELLEKRSEEADTDTTFGAIAEEAARYETVKRRSQFKASVHSH